MVVGYLRCNQLMCSFYGGRTELTGMKDECSALRASALQAKQAITDALRKSPTHTLCTDA